MIDLHFHCLPAIDDGAEGLEEAVAMCRMAAEDGCSDVVATPHQGHSRWPNTDPERLEELLGEVRRHLGDQPRVHLGGEIRIGAELLAELGDPRRAGFAPLAGSRYLLLEFPRGAPIHHPEELVHELRIQGWRPIIAHPEFYPELAEDLALVARMIDAGAMFQLTAMSLTGDFGRRAKGAATRLLDADLAHFVASDAHGTGRRPPGLGAARQVIAARRGEETARRMTHDHPAAVLCDEPLRSSIASDRLASSI